jgi:hypothetical protein
LKNIFVTAFYEVENRYSHKAETSKEDYKRLTEICVDSFKKNLIDLDEVIILNGVTNNYHQLFKDIYWKIRDLWYETPCNIIWSDSDNLCLKPVEIFGKWNKFSMFSSANEHQFSFTNPTCLNLVKNLTPWMMANLRYYPATMNADLWWNVGDDLAYSWIDEWAYETIIYNKMFHSQDIDNYNKFMRPEWNVQCEGIVGSISPETIKNAIIIHCQSTRGSREAIEKMDRALKFQKEG